METEEAIEKAIEFLEKKGGYYTHRLLGIKLEGNVWKMEFDTSIFTKNIIELEIDDKTGRVVRYGKPR
jgi:uncharacterized protein YxjI